MKMGIKASLIYRLSCLHDSSTAKMCHGLSDGNFSKFMIFSKDFPIFDGIFSTVSCVFAHIASIFSALSATCIA